MATHVDIDRATRSDEKAAGAARKAERTASPPQPAAEPASRERVPQRPRLSWKWQDDAACSGQDLVLFFGPDGERQSERDVREGKAKAICSGCPARAACLDYALSRPEKYGVYGGHTPDERASARRRAQRRGLYEPRAAEPITVDAKPCRLCEETLPATAFHKDRRSSDGLNPSCKACTNEAAARRREARQAVA